MAGDPNDEIARSQGLVSIVDPLSGERSTIPEDQLSLAQEKGFVPQTRAEYEASILREDQGAREIEAGLEGAARTVSFGLSDSILPALGVTTKEAIRARKELSPGASLAGEVAGAFVPIGAPGIAGKAGNLLAKGLGAERAGASALRVMAARGLGSGLEGGIMGVGQGVSKLSLSDDPLTVEAIVAELGDSAWTGAKLGAGVGSLAGLTGVAARQAKRVITSRIAEAGERSVGKLEGVADDLASLSMTELRAARKAAEADAKLAQVAAREPMIGEVATIREAARDLSNSVIKRLEEAGKAGVGHGREIIRAERALDAIAKLPETAAREPGKALAALERYETTLAGAKKIIPDAGETLAKMDDAIAGARALRSKIRESVDAVPASPRLESIDAAMDALKNPSLHAQAGSKVKNMIASAGADALTGLATTAGYALGGPAVGAGVGMVARALSGKLEEFLKAGFSKAGPNAAKGLIDGLSAFTSRAKPVVATAPRAAIRYLSETTTPQGTTRTRDPREAVKVKARELAAFKADPMATRRAIYESLAGVREVDPVLADKLETLQMVRHEFLASKAPQMPALGTATNSYDRWMPDERTVSKMSRYVAASVEGPQRLVDELKSNRLTVETVETIRALYPESFRAIQEELMGQVTELRQDLPYDKRLQISILMDVPVDSTSRPEFIASMQERFAQRKVEAQKSAPKAPPQQGARTNPSKQPTAAQRLGA